MFGGYDDGWLGNDAHIADHVVLSVLDLHIVADVTDVSGSGRSILTLSLKSLKIEWVSGYHEQSPHHDARPRRDDAAISRRPKHHHRTAQN